MAEPEKSSTTTESRRGFLKWGVAAIFVAALIAIAAAVIRMMFPNVNETAPVLRKFSAGKLDNIRSDAVDLRFIDKGVWLVRNSTEVFALIARCPMDDCVPVWEQQDEFYRCPCCGSTFLRDGRLFQGDTARSLERAAIQVDADGNVQVDPTRRFRFEAGEWNSADAKIQLQAGHG